MVIAFVDCQVDGDKVIDLPIKNKKFPSELELPVHFIVCKNTFFNLTDRRKFCQAHVSSIICRGLPNFAN